MEKIKKLPYRIETRVDSDKYNELLRLLQNSKHRNMSELLRGIVYDRNITVTTHDKGLDMVLERLLAIRAELHAIGVNINQVTRYFNSDPSPASKVVHATSIAIRYTTVGNRVDELLSLIEKIGQQWLQK